MVGGLCLVCFVLCPLAFTLWSVGCALSFLVSSSGLCFVLRVVGLLACALCYPRRALRYLFSALLHVLRFVGGALWCVLVGCLLWSVPACLVLLLCVLGSLLCDLGVAPLRSVICGSVPCAHSVAVYPLWPPPTLCVLRSVGGGLCSVQGSVVSVVSGLRFAVCALCPLVYALCLAL